jgi:hypothetical protein
MQRKGETLHSYIQRWSIIKNSAKDVSDEWAVDAFSAGLRHLDLVEELGRTRPKTVSELMEIASRFANGEDAYNNKRACSPKVDRASRQRRRSRNEDNHTRCNQVAIGYVMRVNLTNVPDEGLRIRGIGRWMNSKVKISQIRRVSRINMVVDLAYSQSPPDRPLLAPIYRWPGHKEPVGSDTYYSVCLDMDSYFDYDYTWA